MGVRSIRAQLNYAITSNTRIGQSKRAYQRLEDKKDGQIFSIQYAENLRETADAFSRFLNTNYPEVRLVKDIETKHIQAYIDAKHEHWSDKTLDNRISQFKVIAADINHTFRLSQKWEIVKPERPEKAYKVRDKAMEKADFLRLREYFKDKTTEAKKAIEITARTGLRVKEVARLHADRINLDKGVIEVREGAKNGKYRDVPIQPQDRDYFVQLKRDNIGRYICNGVLEQSLCRGIRRALKDLDLDKKYPKTSEHAIRKMYAQDRYHAELEKCQDERRAWEVVQQELGHGERFRQALFNAYINTK